MTEQSWSQGELLYAGKAKSIYATDDPSRVMMLFRDDTSAFNGEKKEALNRKGRVNNQFNAFMMQKLADAGIETHFERVVSPQASLVKAMKMVPLECVVRNVTAGGICKRLGVPAGETLDQPIYELFLKNDELGDPMVNDSHAITFGWATAEQLADMKRLSFAVNDVFKALFAQAGLLLVDYKLEFGVYEGRLVLGDEFSPDGCRIWDAQTREKLDKDRFRMDLGDVIESYELVGHRLGIRFE
ncbi:MAG: phosphoribosylaminoimidazolesuccinocarboxamide synthase [Gammaproteobacteria bacterium]